MGRFLRSLSVIGIVLAMAAPLSGQSPAAGALTIRVGERSVVLSRAELATLPRHNIDAGDGTGADPVTGVSLWDVLERAKAVPAAASGRQRAVMYIRLVGADGQNALIALVEVDPSFSKRLVVLADQRAGRPLDDVEGPWRAIVPDDLRHARWIRGLVTIAVETLK